MTADIESQLELARLFSVLAREAEEQLADLAIENLRVAVTGTREQVLAIITGTAQSLAERNRAETMLCVRGWTIANQLTTATTSESEGAWVTAMDRGDFDLAVRVADEASDATSLVAALCRRGVHCESAEDGEKDLSRAIAVADAELNESDPWQWRAHARLHMNVLLRAKNRYPEAIRMCREAIDILERAWNSDDPRLAEALLALGYCLVEGRSHHDDGLGEVEPLYQRAIALLDDASSSHHRRVLKDAWQMLAALLVLAGRHAEAADAHHRARALDP